jgi:ERCC4-related helicase
VTNYEYQTHSAQKVLQDCLRAGVKAAVLAAAPGSGKTTISHIVINDYINKYPTSRVLVLTHGQNLLKDQYIDSLNSPNVDISFSYGHFNSTNQVRIGIPQAIKKLDWDKIDLLVVDECHEFYLKKMVQNIISQLKPKHQVLLTGSPSIFNKLKKQGENYEITYIAADKLMKSNVFSSVELNVVPVKYRGNSRECIIQMLEMAKNNNKDLSKIMVAVNNINEAKNVAYYLESIGRKVALSTHKNDRNNIVVRDFKNDLYDTLVVVQRGILGFSDNNITGLFDVRCSEDIEISNQLFARVLRKHPNDIQKFYYRCGVKQDSDYNDQVMMLHKMVALMETKIFTGYDGENLTMNVYYI